MVDVLPIIRLYQNFPKYQRYTNAELFHHIAQSVDSKQYKVFRKNNKVIGFCSWAYLSEEEEKHLLETNHIRKGAWNSGNIIWQMDIVAIEDARKIALEIRRHITNLVGVGRIVKWKRVNKSKTIYKQFITKRHYL